MQNRIIGLLFLSLFLITEPQAYSSDSAQILADILASKGVITALERDDVERAEPDGAARMLADLLLKKGLLTQAEVNRLQNSGGTGPFVQASMTVPLPQSSSLKAQQDAPAPPLTAQSKFPVSVYGTLLWNSFFNTSGTNIEDVPLLSTKKGTDRQNFGMTGRQSRLGLRYQGGEIAGAKLSGTAEVDFFGGKAALSNGISMDILRLRLAYGRLEWKKFALVAGQDWSIFAPLNPTSLAGFAIPDLAGSGNPWIRTPQIRAELSSGPSEGTRVQWQIAATDPDVGDFSMASFQTSRTPGIGERGRMPGLDTRLAWMTKASGKDLGIGLSSHYNRGKNLATMEGVTLRRPVDSWGVALDYTLPLGKLVTFTGEAYEGRALGIFTVSTGLSVLPVGSVGEHGVESRGGWIQAQFNVTAKWQTNVAYGLDSPNIAQVRTGDRWKNQTYMTNLMYKYSPHVTFAWEWRRFLTDYKNQPAANNITDHENMAVSYTF